MVGHNIVEACLEAEGSKSRKKELMVICGPGLELTAKILSNKPSAGQGQWMSVKIRGRHTSVASRGEQDINIVRIRLIRGLDSDLAWKSCQRNRNHVSKKRKLVQDGTNTVECFRENTRSALKKLMLGCEPGQE
mmetsp:Transcript_9820/g.17155  ORF Transcript_9820/g.17155 Transcript_9820/m.17155 type:complete len:134 (+) Transcript_9820:369-770(+)